MQSDIPRKKVITIYLIGNAVGGNTVIMKDDLFLKINNKTLN